MALPSLCFFGSAASTGAAPAGFVYKLMGQGDSGDDYRMILEVTNGATASYISQFQLTSLIENMSEEVGVEPSAAMLLDWLRQHFETTEVEAVVGADGGLQLSAEHVWASNDSSICIDIRLPPTGLMQPLADPRRAAWVVQEVLFTQAAHMRRLARKLHECEERCTPEQQYDDLLTFLGSEAAEAAAAADSSSREGGPASPVACRAAHIPSKRKLGSTPMAAGGAAEVPASGSAVKAPRPNDAGEAPAAGAGATAAAAGGGSQQTGGMSNGSRLTDVSEVGMAKKATGARAQAKRGGRGGGSVMAVGRQRK